MIDDIMGKYNPSNTSILDVENAGFSPNTISSYMKGRFGWK